MNVVKLIPFGFLVWLAAACELTVDDETPSPGQYTTASPAGFALGAKVHVSGLMTSPTLKTTVTNLGSQTTTPWNQAVPMVRTAPGNEHFRGTFSVNNPWDLRMFTACGFRLVHQTDSRFFGIFPVTRTAARSVGGNPYAGFIWVGGSSAGMAATASFPSSGGGTITTGNLTISTFTSAWDITLYNGYPQAMVVTKAQLATADPQYVQVSSIPSVPVTLPCGQGTSIFFGCAPEAQTQMGGEATFETNLGSIVVPFTCGTEIGA